MPYFFLSPSCDAVPLKTLTATCAYCCLNAGLGHIHSFAWDPGESYGQVTAP